MNATYTPGNVASAWASVAGRTALIEDAAPAGLLPEAAGRR
jgi:hypothetical protein